MFAFNTCFSHVACSSEVGVESGLDPFMLGIPRVACSSISAAVVRIRPWPPATFDRFCTAAVLRQVSTYRYDFKVMTARNEAGQFLEVDVGSTDAGRARDFKLYLIQVGSTGAVHL